MCKPAYGVHTPSYIMISGASFPGHEAVYWHLLLRLDFYFDAVLYFDDDMFEAQGYLYLATVLGHFDVISTQ